MKIRKGFVSNSSSASFILTISAPMDKVIDHFHSVLRNSYIDHNPIFLKNCEKLSALYMENLDYNKSCIEECADKNCSYSTCYKEADQKTCMKKDCSGNKKYYEGKIKGLEGKIKKIEPLFLKNEYGMTKCEDFDLDDKSLFLFVLRELEDIKISEKNNETEIHCFVPMLNSYVGDIPISFQEYVNHLKFDGGFDFCLKVEKD